MGRFARNDSETDAFRFSFLNELQNQRHRRSTIDTRAVELSSTRSPTPTAAHRVSGSHSGDREQWSGRSAARAAPTARSRFRSCCCCAALLGWRPAMRMPSGRAVPARLTCDSACFVPPLIRSQLRPLHPASADELAHGRCAAHCRQSWTAAWICRSMRNHSNKDNNSNRCSSSSQPHSSCSHWRPRSRCNGGICLRCGRYSRWVMALQHWAASEVGSVRADCAL